MPTPRPTHASIQDLRANLDRLHAQVPDPIVLTTDHDHIDRLGLPSVVTLINQARCQAADRWLDQLTPYAKALALNQEPCDIPPLDDDAPTTWGRAFLDQLEHIVFTSMYRPHFELLEDPTLGPTTAWRLLCMGEPHWRPKDYAGFAHRAYRQQHLPILIHALQAPGGLAQVLANLVKDTAPVDRAWQWAMLDAYGTKVTPDQRTALLATLHAHPRIHPDQVTQGLPSTHAQIRHQHLAAQPNAPSRLRHRP